MSQDPNELVNLCDARTSFEADTIAACLADRGFRAQAMTTTARMVQWEGGIGNTPRVQVPRSELEAARIALAEVKEEAKSVDWVYEIENASSIDAGKMCEYCGELRDPSDRGNACTHCKRAPSNFTDNTAVEPPTVRWRARYLLYAGGVLILVPAIISLIAAVIKARSH